MENLISVHLVTDDNKNKLKNMSIKGKDMAKKKGNIWVTFVIVSNSEPNKTTIYWKHDKGGGSR